MTWLGDNWELVLLGAVVAVQVVNAVTERWDAMQGAWPRRLLALVTEMAAIVTSRGHVNPWLERVPLLGVLLGRLKLPLSPYGGTHKLPTPRPVSFPPGPPLVLFALLGGLIVTDGCATWADKADKSIRLAKVTAVNGWDTARALYRERCSGIITTCPKTQSIDGCTTYQECAGQRSNHATAFRGVLEMCAAASDALAAYERLKPGDPEAVKLRAEVELRKNKATRESQDFTEKLTAAGVAK